MQKLHILNSREKKPIVEAMKRQWGYEGKIDLVFMQNSKGKIFLINRDIERIDLEKLRVDSMGLYFGTMTGTELRLSIDGSQMIGPHATKNILELDDQKAREWLKGKDLEVTSECNGYVLIKNKNDFIGTGKLRGNELLTFIPKNRRIFADD